MKMYLRKKYIIFLFILMFSLFIPKYACASDEETQDLKVLVIEINPILNSITNKKLYSNNNGHPKVSEFFGHDTYKAIEELKEDLEFASHGYLNIILSYEYLNEFPRYTKCINNTDLKSFTEELYLSYCRSSNNPDQGNWNNLLSNDVFGMIPAYSFDYEYLIEKFDLVNRRNAGEFDQVWLNTIDPVQTYETMMVGKAPYWINGNPIKKNCNNFIIANISISRRDANLHALGHGVEGIMSKAFNGTGFSYNKTFDDTTEEEYRALNLWEQFSMTSSESAGNNSGIGNVHWPFNAEKGYDYSNSREVYSYWKNWLNYPDLSGEKVLSDDSAWLKWEKNTSLGDNQNKNPDRLYMRLWFYLFPHIPGVTEDGHLNNWWKYFVSLDYAEKVNCKFDEKIYSNISHSFSDSLFSVMYSSEIEKDISLQSDFAKITIQNPDIIELTEDGKLAPIGTGSTIITCFVDGKFAQYIVNVLGKDGDFDVNFEAIKNPSNIKGLFNIDEWAKDEMKKANKKGLIPDTLVNKDATSKITRLDFAAVAVKLYEALTNKKAESVTNNPFNDTNDTYVLKAYALGITQGTSQDTFSPNKEITREQLATMITRVLKEAGIDTSINLNAITRFSDDNLMSDWGRPSVYYMASKEIIKGVGDNKFNPLGNAKVEEALAIAVRCIETFKK